MAQVFKYEVRATSNLTDERIGMLARNKKEALEKVRDLKKDNKAHQQAENFTMWKNIRIVRRKN